MSQVAAAEATYPPVEGITVFWKLAGEVSSTTPSASTLTIRRDPTVTPPPCTKTDHYLYVRRRYPALGDDTLLAHSDGGSTLTLEVGADVASVQAFLQCGERVVYNEIDVAALREEYLAAEEAERLEREKKAAEKEEAEKEAANPAGTSSDVSSDSSSSEVLGLALGLGLGIALCLLCVGMLIFYSRRRKREAPAAPQIVLPPPGAGDDGRASIGRAYYEQHGMTMTEAITNKV